MSPNHDAVATQVAEALLNMGAVGFPAEPITFKSGIKSPVYVDNRRIPFHPASWKKIIQGFADLIQEEGIEFDCIAGIETAGIPHSAALGFHLQKPSVFVRKEVKDHGTKKRVDGGEVVGRRVLLIEDHITTGMSSLSGVAALRAEGATVTDCLAITSYDFSEAKTAFKDADVKTHILCSFNQILGFLKSKNYTHQNKIDEVDAWIKNPKSWQPIKN